MTARSKKDGSEVADADQQLEQENASVKTPEQVGQVVVFHLGAQRYGLPIERVSEIQQIVAFANVPADGLGVVGMVNLRGEVIPAIDVRMLVGMEACAYTLETPMIIARSGVHVVALLVDEVEDVVELPKDSIQAVSPMHALSSKMIGVSSLNGGLVYVLDVDRLLGQGLLGEGAGDE